MDTSDLTTWSEIIRNTLVTLGVLAGAIWAFYVFVLGRNTTANVQIDYALKDVINRADDETAAVIGVTLKNTGRTQVFKVDTGRAQVVKKEDGCTVTITPIIALPPKGRREPYLISLSSINKWNRPYIRKWSIFEKLESLQPGEEAEEDFLFSWSDSLKFLSSIPTFMIEVRFVGREAITFREWIFYIGKQKVDLTRLGGHLRVWRRSLRKGSPQHAEPQSTLPRGVQS